MFMLILVVVLMPFGSLKQALVVTLFADSYLFFPHFFYGYCCAGHDGGGHARRVARSERPFRGARSSLR